MNRVLEVNSITIPTVGKCTLVPSFKEGNFSLDTYEKVAKVAKALGLEEFPELTDCQKSQIFRALSQALSESGLEKEVGFGIILSGARDVYPSINTDDIDLPPQSCVILMDFCSWNKKDGKLSNGPFPNHFEKVFDELPIGEDFTIGDKNILFTLFSGTYEPGVFE